MNKTLLLVARIISLITGIIYCITIVAIPIGVLNIIASSKFDKALNDDPNVTKDTVRGWSIYLLFTDLVSGLLAIFSTLMEDKDTIDFTSTNSSFTYTGSSRGSNIDERLRNLRNLYDSGLINRDEYDRRRQEIIDEI